MAEGTVIAEENLGLVHACAGRFKGRGIEYDDLFQAGCVGLVKAADHFDSQRGFRFSTYAVPVILGEIKRLFRDGGAVKISRSLRQLASRITNESQLFEQENGREPTIGELSDRLGLDPEQIAEGINAARQPVSLTDNEDDGSGQSDIPVPAPDEAITDRLALHTEIGRLPEQDKRLLDLRFFQGMTQSRTADLLGMTQVQVSRREKKLLLYLRQQLSA